MQFQEFTQNFGADRSRVAQTVFHSTASSLPIPFVICRLLLTASSGAKYDEKSGLGRCNSRSLPRILGQIDRGWHRLFSTPPPLRCLSLLLSAACSSLPAPEQNTMRNPG